MPKFFISYRREDSAHQADRLHTALKNIVRDPRADIFIDIDNIPVGVDFAAHLENKITQSDVVIALIGPAWLDARDKVSGRRRLEDPEDFVRMELASAFRKGRPVAPVLLDGASMPDPRDLPEELKKLARLQAIEIRRSTFEADSQRLMQGLRAMTPSARKAPSRKRDSGSGRAPALIAGIAALAVIGGGFAAWAIYGRTGQAEVSPPAPAAASRLETAAEGKATPPPVTAAPSAPAIPPAPDTANTKPPAETPARPAPAAKAATPKIVSGARLPDICPYCPPMIAIASGAFTMGKPGDSAPLAHEVRIQKPFALAVHEVTVDEYSACVNAGYCSRPKQSVFNGRLPVTNISWDEARGYAAWLSQAVGKPYRLPSEAEWEFAASLGMGPLQDDVCAYANIASCQAGQRPGAKLAASLQPDRLGFADLSGNVSEWIEDCFSETYDGAPADGSARVTGLCARRVVRGGSYFDNSLRASPYARDGQSETTQGATIGFRLAMSLETN